MANIAGLGYVGIRSAKIDEWEEFATDVLGMQVRRTDDDVLFIRMDDRPHRIVVRPSDGEQLDYVGWEVPDSSALDDAAAVLSEYGLAYERISGDDARERRDVADYIAFVDPAGSNVELFSGARTLSLPFVNAYGSRFVTGEFGIGHVFSVVENFDRVCDFYERLGFRLSDSAERGAFRFYRCNARQHSLGLGDVRWSDELEPGLNHFMVEAADMDAVGLAYDRCLDGKAPIAMTLGRHSNDGMFSFYVQSPSGWEMEYGWGGLRVDEDTWRVTELTVDSIWGHKPADVAVHAAPRDGAQ